MKINYKNNHSKSESGFTLLELIVVLSLFGISMAIGYRLLHFSQNSFQKGESRYITQGNARLASDFITKELRYAESVTILADIPEIFDASKRYLFIRNGRLQQNLNGRTDDVLRAFNNDVDFTLLTFRKSMEDAGILNFSITTAAYGSEYHTESEVDILNLPEGLEIGGSGLPESEEGNVICYYVE